jgi:DNA-binding transcriptional LysR family regulator
MENWDEVRTAFQVARMGTVSGAAEVLGVHHATVIRHIDSLEGRLGVKLFQRHARGYTATEAGEDLLRVAQTTDDQFQQLEGRIKGRGADVSGDLVVTSLVSFAPFLVPALNAFRKDHPDVQVRFLTGERLFRLEYGEAHVALRAGGAPQEPDNVVQPLGTFRVGLYGHKDYIAERGLPTDVAALAEHDFIAHDEPDNRAPFYQWLRAHVPADRVVFRGTDNRVMEEAVLTGAGLGFIGVSTAKTYPNLVPVLEPLDDWAVPLWLVTHVDLHRTAKVQAFLTHLKSFVADIMI